MASHHVNFSSYSCIFGSLDFLCLPEGDMLRLLPTPGDDADSITKPIGGLHLNKDGAPAPMTPHSSTPPARFDSDGPKGFDGQSLPEVIPGSLVPSDVDSDAATWGSGDDLDPLDHNAWEAILRFMLTQWDYLLKDYGSDDESSDDGGMTPPVSASWWNCPMSRRAQWGIARPPS
jgi:hypothetical protein